MVYRMEVCDVTFTPWASDLELPIIGEGVEFYDVDFPDDPDQFISETGVCIDGEIVGYATWRYLRATEKTKIITPMMVSLKKACRGKNMAERLYNYVMDNGYIIQAGDIKNVQSKGGESIWLKMADNPEIEMFCQEDFFASPEKIKNRADLEFVLDFYDKETILFMRKSRGF